MAHQHHDEEDDKPPVHDESNWLVSYADMMTLLFGFFVLMYSLSRVDVEKFEVVSKDIAQFFGGKVKEDTGIKVVTQDVKEFIGTYMKEMQKARETGKAGETAGDTFAAGQLPPEQTPSDEMPLEKAVEIENTPSTLTLKFKGSILFGSGSAQLKPEFEQMLTELAQKLKASQRIDEVRVEGHTDDDPIKSVVFPTNWELSAARASRIIRQFEAVGVESERLIAQGYGSSRPEVPNRDPEGKALKDNQAQNRRVVVKVNFTPLKGQQPQADLGAEYFEKVQKMKAGPQVQVADSGALGDASGEVDIEARIRQAQSRLEEAQKRLRANEEENRKRQKLLDLERKLEQLNRKAQEAESRLNKDGEPEQQPETAPANKQPASVPGQ